MPAISRIQIACDAPAGARKAAGTANPRIQTRPQPGATATGQSFFPAPVACRWLRSSFTFFADAVCAGQ